MATQIHVNKNRESWCTYHNLKDMYDLLFESWLEDKYIEDLPIPHWQDQLGNEVQVHNSNRLGRKVKYRWVHPDMMLCADEVGHNTNMERDKLPKGCRRVTERGRKAKIPVSNDDIHFTSLCFTTMSGDPIVMVTIMAQKKKRLTSTTTLV